MERGYLCEERGIPEGRGRVPLYLSLNRYSHLVLGVSLRPAESSAALAGLTGEFSRLIPFKTTADPETFVQKVSQIVEEVESAFPATAAPPVERIVVSVPGLVHSRSGRVIWLPTLPEYSGFDLANRIQAATGVPASVENDSNLAAIAELGLDRTGDLCDFVVVCPTGEGVGTGIVVNREVYKGHDTSFAGEFGHMCIDPDGPLCPCGKQGCWELYVRDRATWNRFRPDTDFDPAHFHELLEAAEGGDEYAVAAVRETAHYLSLGISNIFLALNPEVVILTGQITRVWDLIIDAFRKTFSSADVAIPVRPARVEAEHLYLHGAIFYALQSVLGQPKLGF